MSSSIVHISFKLTREGGLGTLMAERMEASCSCWRYSSTVVLSTRKTSSYVGLSSTVCKALSSLQDFLCFKASSQE